MRILLNRPVSIQGIDFSMDADVSSQCSGSIQSLLAVGWARQVDGDTQAVESVPEPEPQPAVVTQEESKPDAEQTAVAVDSVEVVQDSTSIDTLDLPPKIKASLKRQGLETVESLIKYHDKNKSFEPLRDIGRTASKQIENQIGR